MKICIAGVLVFVASYFGYMYTQNNNQRNTLTDAVFAETVSYACADGKTLTASFGDKIVRVTLLDEQISLTLEQISVHDEDGTKFGSEDEQFVFWVKDQSAFLEENGKTTYAACRMS